MTVPGASSPAAVDLYLLNLKGALIKNEWNQGRMREEGEKKGKDGLVI